MDRDEIEITRLKEHIADLKAEIVELSGKIHPDKKVEERAGSPLIGAMRGTPAALSSVAVAAGLLGLTAGYLLASGVGTAAHYRRHS